MSAIILVAEQYPLARASLSELLRLDGYRVLEAHDRDAAIAGLNESSGVHALLSDLEMPGWDSIVIHALNLSPNTYVLGMARYGQLPREPELKRIGLYDYFFKPLDYSDIRKKISQALSGHNFY